MSVGDLSGLKSQDLVDLLGIGEGEAEAILRIHLKRLKREVLSWLWKKMKILFLHQLYQPTKAFLSLVRKKKKVERISFRC